MSLHKYSSKGVKSAKLGYRFYLPFINTYIVFKVVTSVPESSAPSPPYVRGARWAAVGALVQLVADALIAVAFCNEAIRLPMFATGIPRK